MVPFHKLSGGGNDFLALAEPPEDPSAVEIGAWCRRGLSIGADGLFVLRRTEPGRVRMSYWNADGFPADLCLNGTRCAAQLAFTLGWDDRGGLEIETPAAAIPARRVDETATALEVPIPAPPEAITVDGPAGPCRGFRIMAGVPHFVLLWPEGLADAPVVPWGRVLRYHEAFGVAGTNVDFVRPAAGGFEVRTYERGVEDETLCCGTGVVASAAVALATGPLHLPLRAATAGGFELSVSEAGPGRWTLAGDARLVARGEILSGAIPSPSR
jgi:diaminopimelate epimerase